MKAVGKLLREKRRREFSLLPAFAPHQRGEKRNVVPHPLDHEGVERVGLSGGRCPARRRPSDQLGDERIVIKGNFAAFAHTAIDTHRRARLDRMRRRSITNEAAD